MKLFSFRNVSFQYPEGPYVLRDLSVDLDKGRFYILKGPSGSGKSTFLRLMNRLEDPCAGNLLFKGEDICTRDATELRRSILYIQQTPVVVKGSVRENLLLPFEFRANQGMKSPSEDYLKEMLSHFSLAEISPDADAQGLSVGQQQRICFIRGLLLKPEIILLDEPTSALDEASSRIVEQMAGQLATQKGATVVMVSHKSDAPDLHVLEHLYLENGSIVLGRR